MDNNELNIQVVFKVCCSVWFTFWDKSCNFSFFGIKPFYLRRKYKYFIFVFNLIHQKSWVIFFIHILFIFSQSLQEFHFNNLWMSEFLLFFFIFLPSLLNSLLTICGIVKIKLRSLALVWFGFNKYVIRNIKSNDLQNDFYWKEFLYWIISERNKYYLCIFSSIMLCWCLCDN